jgi:hypothetical protein
MAANAVRALIVAALENHAVARCIGEYAELGVQSAAAQPQHPHPDFKPAVARQPREHLQATLLQCVRRGAEPF